MDPDWTVRRATPRDHASVRRLLLDAAYRHEHLDWAQALDLLDQAPFLLAFSGRTCVGCLACPPDLPGVAWVRLCFIDGQVRPEQLWDRLWPPACRKLAAEGVSLVAALPVSEWLAPLLEQAGFQRSDEVVFLIWEGLPPDRPSTPAELRDFRVGDLPAVASVDHHAFAPIWRLSNGSLAQALDQAEVASLAVVEGAVVGYQISTASALGAHLARLAVHPDLQRRGIGRLLVADALGQLHRRGFQRTTVNTQVSNLPSLALYRRLGFRRTGQDYPVYTLTLPAT